MQHYEQKISRRMRECKSLCAPLELKQLDQDGHFAGYASVFDVIDTQNDAVQHGAFSETLRSNSRNIKLLWQHNIDEPIGVIDTIFEDPQGLYVEGRLLMDVPRAKEAYSLLKEGVVKGMSIGYSPVRFSYDPDNGVRKLHALDLFEVSLVTFPANQEAQVTVFKSDKPNCDDSMRRNRFARRCVASTRQSSVKRSGSLRRCAPRETTLTASENHFWKQAASNGHALKLHEALERATKVLQ